MTGLDLYKFVTDNKLEYHWHEGNNDFILFVDYSDIKEFQDLLGDGIMDENGIDCTMKSGYFCFWMKDICEYFDISAEEIFKKDN